jgi:uncharacterized phage infection (PIP) family protein YhgE
MASIDPDERTVRELRTDVREIDDPAELREMRDAEAEGKDRKSAKEAIERRLARLEEDEASGSDGETDEGEGDTAGEERTTDETPGTSVETAIGTTGQRLDSIGAQDEDDTMGMAKAGANADSMDDGDYRGIGAGGGIGAIEPTETAESGENRDDETNDTSGRSTSSELRERLSAFETGTENEADATTEATDGDGEDSSSEHEDEERTSETESDNETAENGDDSDESDDEVDDEAEEDEADNGRGERLTDTTEDTMSETETRSETDRDAEASDELPAEAEGTDETDGTETSDETGHEDESDVPSGGNVSLIDIRNEIRDTAADLIGRRLDGISGIQRTDDGWYAIVNMIERRSVPDTQDILGRYEITFDSSGNLEGYRRLSRYRRGDTTEEDWQ